MKYKEIKQFVFNDGVKQFEVIKTYDNWLTSINFGDFSKSYIVVDNEVSYLFRGEKELVVGNDFSLIDIEEIAVNYKLDITKSNSEIRCLTKAHCFDRFFIVKNNQCLIIYAIGGTKSFESIYIHGVWELL